MKMNIKNEANPLGLDIEKITAFLLSDINWKDVLKIHCLTQEYNMSNIEYDDYYEDVPTLWLEAKHLIEEGISIYKGDEETYLFVESDNFILAFDYIEWGDITLIYSPREYRNTITFDSTDIDVAIDKLKTSKHILNLYKINLIFNEMNYKYGFGEGITPNRLLQTVATISKSAMKCGLETEDCGGGYSSCGRFIVHYKNDDNSIYVCFTPIESMCRMYLLDGTYFHPYEDIEDNSETTYSINENLNNDND